MHEYVGGNWKQLIIESIGFMIASIAFDVLYIYYWVELFPTYVRNFVEVHTWWPNTKTERNTYKIRLERVEALNREAKKHKVVH